MTLQPTPSLFFTRPRPPLPILYPPSHNPYLLFTPTPLSFTVIPPSQFVLCASFLYGPTIYKLHFLYIFSVHQASLPCPPQGITRLGCLNCCRLLLMRAIIGESRWLFLILQRIYAIGSLRHYCNITFPDITMTLYSPLDVLG